MIPMAMELDLEFTFRGSSKAEMVIHENFAALYLLLQQLAWSMHIHSRQNNASCQPLPLVQRKQRQFCFQCACPTSMLCFNFDVEFPRPASLTKALQTSGFQQYPQFKELEYASRSTSESSFQLLPVPKCLGFNSHFVPTVPLSIDSFHFLDS